MKRVWSGLVLCLAVALTPASVHAQPAGPTAEATQHFTRGTEHYDAKRFQDALLEFRRSFEAYGSPNTRFAIARCLRELGRYPEAVTEYELTIQEARDRAATESSYNNTADAAKAELARVLARVGRVKIMVSPGGDDVGIRVNGQDVPVANLSKPLPVAPGNVVIEVTKPGFVPVHKELEASPGLEAEARVNLSPVVLDKDGTPVVVPPPAAARAPSENDDSSVVPILGWVGVSTGVVASGLFVAFYFLADGQHETLRKECVDGSCTRTRHDDLASTGRTYETVTNVALGVGIGALLVGGALLLWDNLAAGNGDHAAAATPTVAISGSGASIGLRTEF